MPIGRRLAVALEENRLEVERFLRSLPTPTPVCAFCGAEVDCSPGKYMMAFGQGTGPRHGSWNYLCGACANWMA